MTTDTQKSTALRFIQALDSQRWEELTAITSPSLRVEIGAQVLDRDQWLGMGQMFAGAFPEGRHEIRETLAEGDRVVLRGVWRGTHRGTFQGIPASGRAVEVATIMIERVAEDRVVEHVGVFDAMALMAQIGAMPGH